MYKRYNQYVQPKVAGDALESISGLGINLLTNYDGNAIWYAEEGLETRFKQEEAKVGDHFWDGNNGDKHTVLAVDLQSSRLAYRNEDQNDEHIEIAVW